MSINFSVLNNTSVFQSVSDLRYLSKITTLWFTLVVNLLLAIPAFAELVNPGSWSRGENRTLYAEWDVFNSDQDATPDVGSANIGAAELTETAGGSFLTSGGNIYNLGLRSRFVLTVRGNVSGPVAGENATVYLQVATKGTNLDMDSVKLGGVLAKTAKLVSSTSLGGHGGADNVYQFSWTTASVAEWVFNFDAAEASMSLDKVAVDIRSIEGSIAESDPEIVTKTFYSSPTSDGLILESTESSSKGGTIKTAGNLLRVGDSAGDRQYRSFLHFNTASLPNDAVITNAKLMLKRYAISGSVSTLGSLKGDIKKGYFGSSMALQAGDFQAPSDRASVITLAVASGSSSYKGEFNAASYPYISLTGTTQIKLRYANTDNDNKNADYVNFYSGDYSTLAYRPALVISYYRSAK